MKVAIVALISVGVFSLFKLNDLLAKPITIHYLSKGIPANIVKKTLYSWNQVATFKQCDTEEEADLILQRVDKCSMVNPINYGEYKDKTVSINSRYNFNERDIQIILTHEVGHFLGLTHTACKHSIMNDLTPLDRRKITAKDVDQAKKNRFKMLLKIAIRQILF